MIVLVFELGSVRCGLPALQISEIVRAVTIVPLPQVHGGSLAFDFSADSGTAWC
jgi:chemotaxis signal transduction protein